MVEHRGSVEVIDRPELRRRLDQALRCPVTLVVAQPGAGKTVLLRQWAAQRSGESFVWLDVDTGDDDPARFTRRLLAGLQEVRGEAAALGGFAALNAGGLGTAMLDALSAELEAFPETVIVFDDFHHLGNSTLIADVGRLGSVLPPNVHLIIATRVDPAIAWSQLRLRGRLLEVRQADLALTDDESAALLANVTRRDIPPEVRDVLVKRTEGWAAGLQLAALTLRFHRSPDRFVADFNGTDRLVADYLTEEVLEALPPGGRLLLLRMAALDVMSAELIDHVFERSDGQDLLDRLEQESMFLVALDTGRQQFRFHQLFRDLLRYHLRAEEPTEEIRLLRRGADFHLARGEVTPAVEYLLRAKDWTSALDAIMTRGSEVFERGEMRTVVRWISSVPESVRAQRLDVTLELGILVGMQGEITSAVDSLARVTNDPHASIGQQMIASAWMSATVQWTPRPEESIRAAESAVELLEAHPDEHPPDLLGVTSRSHLGALAIGSTGRAYFFAGDHRRSELWLERVLASDGIRYPPFRVGFIGTLALLRAWCGQLVDAELLAAEAIDAAAQAGLLTHPVIADAFFARALVAIERGLLVEAAEPLTAAVVRADANHRTQLAWLGHYLRGVLAADSGGFHEAFDLADVSNGDVPSGPAPALRDRLTALRMQVLRRTGSPDEALHVAGDDVDPSSSTRFEGIASALTLGRLGVARRLIDDAGASPDATTRESVQLLLSRAWLAQLAGEGNDAIALAREALDVAEPHGLVSSFVESDPAVIGLIERLAHERSGLADVIMSRWRERHPPGPNTVLPDPLTGRELEILGFLTEFSTNGELAQRCFVSLNTVKSHVAHIYRKLGVTGRSAAIVRARELGLLDQTASVPPTVTDSISTWSPRSSSRMPNNLA